MKGITYWTHSVVRHLTPSHWLRSFQSHSVRHYCHHLILSTVNGAALEISLQYDDKIGNLYCFRLLPRRERFLGYLSQLIPWMYWKEHNKHVWYCEVWCSRNHISVAVNTGSQSLRLRPDNSDDHADVISSFIHWNHQADDSLFSTFAPAVSSPHP